MPFFSPVTQREGSCLLVPQRSYGPGLPLHQTQVYAWVGSTSVYASFLFGPFLWHKFALKNRFANEH